MSTPEELINKMADEKFSKIFDRIGNLEGNDYYRPVDGVGATTNPPTQVEMDGILGVPTSYKSNMVGLIRDTTNGRSWIVFGETDTNDWYAVRVGIAAIPEAPSDGFMYARRNGAWVSGGFSFQNNVRFGDGTGDKFININGGAGNSRDVRFESNASLRWVIRADNAAESGSNAGTGFAILARDDSGGAITTPLYIVRATGYIATGNNPTPLGQFDINQGSTTAAVPTLVLRQSDVSEEFIDFRSSVGAGQPIDGAAIGSYYGKIRVAVNGTFKYMALYDT